MPEEVETAMRLQMAAERKRRATACLAERPAAAEPFRHRSEKVCKAGSSMARFF